MRHFAPVCVLLALPIAAVACGDDDDDQPGRPTAGTGGMGGLSGQGGAGGGGAGRAGSNAGASGQGGNAGASGQGGNAGASGQGGNAGASGQGGNAGAGQGGSGGSGGGGLICQPGTVAVVGSLGATVVNETFSSSSFQAPYDSADITLGFGPEGRLYVEPAGPIQGTESTPITALLQLPATDARARTFVCAGQPSGLVGDFQGEAPPTWTASLVSLSALGTCPGGTPVGGDVVITFSNGKELSLMTSTLQGAAFTSPLGGTTTSGNLDTLRVVAETTTESRPGVAFFAFDVAPTAPLVEGAFLVIPDGAPDAGAVYCAGAGSTVTTSGPIEDLSLGTLSLKNLTRLGTCPAAASSGRIDLCAG